MIFKRKKKVVIDFVFINLSNRDDFINKLKKEIGVFQGNGLEVDVKYSLNGSFSALVLAYEVK